MATLDGKKTHHGLGSIAIANGEKMVITCHENKIPRDKKESWNNITPCEGIEIHQYFGPEVPALTKTILKPTFQVIIECFLIDEFCGYVNPVNKMISFNFAYLFESRSN